MVHGELSSKVQGLGEFDEAVAAFDTLIVGKNQKQTEDEKGFGYFNEEGEKVSYGLGIKCIRLVDGQMRYPEDLDEGEMDDSDDDMRNKPDKSLFNYKINGANRRADLQNSSGQN
jgi:hypothetical protein